MKGEDWRLRGSGGKGMGFVDGGIGCGDRNRR
jgi:hypothetical protein